MRHALAPLALLVASSSVSAMTFSTLKLDEGGTVIMASGEITVGDDRRLHDFVGALPASTRLVAVALDSPGGNLREGVYLATSIHSTHLPTIVGPGAICASACFLMFVGGSKRLVDETGRVGVHSASSADGEDPTALAVTTLMARKANELGVPPGIIGKMVTTPASNITWLTRQDFADMGVTVVPSAASYTPGSPLTPGTSATQTAPNTTPVFPIGPNATPPVASMARDNTLDPAYQQGRSDRAFYEQWFKNLQGIASEGAQWWAANRSQAAKNHLTCQGAPGAADSDYVRGCLQAQQALTPSDKRRQSEPLYKAGWNSP